MTEPEARLQPHGSVVLDTLLFLLDKTRRLRYITPMPPPTPLPVIAQLIGLFRQGFWRRLAGRFFRRGAPQPAEDPVEEFLLPILEAIAKRSRTGPTGSRSTPPNRPTRHRKPPAGSNRRSPRRNHRRSERRSPRGSTGRFPPGPERPGPRPPQSRRSGHPPHPEHPVRPSGSAHHGRLPAPPPGHRARRPGFASDQKKPARSL
jgi:hypothetical protein